MRGRTWQFNVNQIAAQLAGFGWPAKEVAVKAADIVDAVYAEQKARNNSEVEEGFKKLFDQSKGVEEPWVYPPNNQQKPGMAPEDQFGKLKGGTE